MLHPQQNNPPPTSTHELLVWRDRLSTRLARLQDEIARRMQWQRGCLLHHRETDPQPVFDWITRTCLKGFDCQQVSLMVFNQETEELVVRSAIGHADMARALGAHVKLGEGIAGWVAKRREPLLLGRDVQPGRYKGFERKTHPLTAAMVMPLILGDKLIGVLNVSSRSPGITYSEEDLRNLRLFSLVKALYCFQAMRIEWMAQTLEELDAILLTEEIADLQKAA